MSLDPSNPFLALFESEVSKETGQGVSVLTELTESIFGLTLDAKKASQLFYLSELSQEKRAVVSMDRSTLERAVFERLLVEDVGETRVLVYLYQCYQRLKRRHREMLKSRNDLVTDDLSFMGSLIARNASLTLSQPELFHGQELSSQLLVLLKEHESFEMNDLFFSFLALVFSDTEINEETAKVFTHVLDNLHEQLKSINFGAISLSVVNQLVYFTADEKLAKLLLDYNQVDRLHQQHGFKYGLTLFGTLLSKSCLPKTELEAYDFFESPSAHSSAVHNNTEMRVHSLMSNQMEAITQLFSKLLRCTDRIRHLTLDWIAQCLQANSDRGKLWNSELSLLASNQVGDGFMLNLSSVLLRLCKPFVEGIDNPRLLKIDLSYTKVRLEDQELQMRSVHLRDLDKETFLVPDDRDEIDRDEVKNCSLSSAPNFMTDVFFLTHKSLDLGMRVSHEKLIKLNQELSRQMNLYNEVRAQASPQAEEIQKRTEMLLQRFLSLKAALMEPDTLMMQSQLCSATCSLLVQAVINDTSEGQEVAKKSFKKLKLPLEHKCVAELRKVPEFLVSNVSEHLLLVRRFRPEHFEECDYLNLSKLIDFVLVFMASPEFIRNPHLRARLAENLECLLPMHKQQGASSFIGGYQREQLFQTHPYRFELVSALMDVFVSIETTGEAVEFEQKFSYRRPMYDVIKYLWDNEDYKQKFVSLAEEAELHMLDERAPLFLRFVHLLINDAIFLLDEALAFMKQLQEQEAQRQQWSELSAQERAQNEAQFAHIGRLARYHNIMGLETIGVLERLSSATTLVLTHSTMVDRVAAMLNYFLKTLVGPDRNTFKVSDIEKYEFKPKQIVTVISLIYTHFSDSASFKKAVTNDGRSYSSELFKQAEKVLERIHEDDLALKLIELSKQLQSEAENEALDEVLLADAPDHYLDPIMSSIMRDPVLLPTSGKVVDRQTIARHLLSDQSDPFNRAPLTLDKVIPQIELRTQIEEWIDSKRRELSQKEQESHAMN